ncbi:MAG TPA: SDR family oxidoreductase [Candidatus Binatia bacterium]|jgi:all-trans-retinol dehydrogenase (NAD+)
MTAFRDSTVLLTGAASGLGLLMARQMGAEGARLVLWDVNAAGLDSARAELQRSGVQVATYTCDLSDRDAIAATAARTLAEQGPVDILVNNAGIVSGKTLLDASDADIERTFAVNSLALFWTTRAFLPGMLARNRGHIVTIASAAGIVGTAKLVDYCASKHAAVGFDEALRLELRRERRPIVTTVVCPFYVSTGMFTGVRTRFSWLLPILEPAYAVKRILHGIRQNQRRIIMPRLVALTYLGRLMPVAAFDALMEFLGVSRSMDEFRGRAPIAEPARVDAPRAADGARR